MRSLVVIVLVALGAGKGHAGLIRFLVAEYSAPVHHDSFVIAIEEADVQKIAHARQIVTWVKQGADPKTTPDEKIVVVGIAEGGDTINRNYLAPGAPPWSWHTVGPVEFAAATIEILDGWPTSVEQDVPGWIANTNGFIGFWSYTVVDELGPVEEIPEPSTCVLACLGAWFVMRCARRKAMTRGSIATRRFPSPARAFTGRAFRLVLTAFGREDSFRWD